MDLQPTRRDVMKAGLVGAGALALGGLGGPQAVLGATAKPQRKLAKSVIQIWMWGGPCHVDTFDPKPNAGEEITGPLKDVVNTNVDGIQLNASLPLLAKQADKFSIIRSMTHGVNAHETASYLMQTGRMPGRLVYPCAGAVVSLFKGYEHGYQGIVPPYIVLTKPQGRFSEAGFLGHKHKPFCTGGDPNGSRFVVEGIVAQGVSDERQRSRRALMHDLDSLGRANARSRQLQHFDQTETAAYDMMFGKARDLFDLSKESDEMRERYGRTKFGQSCLMARRLVEIGVPYITINYGGWDTHKQHFQTMNRKLPEMDKAMATLFTDLSDRGLLDNTIVWWGGEFGRGPKVQWNPPWNGGRSHYGKCFSVLLGGGGFAGGHVIGESDDRAMNVVDRPVYPPDLIGSIYARMGIDPNQAMPNPRGLDLKVLPSEFKGKPTAGLLKEIMA